MNKEFFEKLVDLYASNELSQELNQEIEAYALTDQNFGQDIASLRLTVESVRDLPNIEFTEESYQRILMKMYARGVDIQPKAPTPSHLQYHLPIIG